MASEKKRVKKFIEHPLEETFNIERGTTMVERTEVSTELVDYNDYDEKDKEIEEQYQDIYDHAIETHEKLQDELEECDPKHVARISEVSITALNLALNAVSMKAKQKEVKDKINSKQSGGNSTGNVVMTTAALIKMIKTGEVVDAEDYEDVEDAEFTEIDTRDDDDDTKNEE